MSDNKPLVEKITELVENTGFPLENDCVRLLSSKGWILSKGQPFLDPDESILRELDMSAIKMETYGVRNLPMPMASISLMIECKTSKRPWIFFPASTGMYDPLSSIRHDTSIERLLPSGPLAAPAQVSADDLASWGHPYSQPVSYANTYLVFAGKPKDASGREIRSALMTTVKSTDDQMKRMNKNLKSLASPGYATFYYPIVVFRGGLFEATSDEKGQIVVRGSFHVRVGVDYMSPDEDFNYTAMRHIVDVIHEKALPQYIESLETSHVPLFTRVGELLDPAAKPAP